MVSNSISDRTVKNSFISDVPSFHVAVTVVGMRVYPEGDGSTFSERKGYCISYVPVGR